MTNPSAQSNQKHKLPSNFNVLTFSAPCPSCGATVEFASAGSVMAVCEYCQTTVLREGNDVHSHGKQSETVEDYSPLQIGSIGTYQSNQFVLVGRIQYQYTEGIWNEWYLQFSNGHNGWLSEALGQYSLTLSKGEQPTLPNYDDLLINQTIQFDNLAFTITDKRTAQAIAGEGELPFVMGAGFQTWVADARHQRHFISLDYSDQGTQGVPTVYKGISVSLEQLAMQLLKDDRQVNESSSQAFAGGANPDKNKIDKLDCPNCGSPVPYVAGVTNCILCPACHSEIQLTGNSAEVVQIHSMMQAFNSSLPLGAKARIKEVDISNVSQFSSDSDKGNPSSPQSSNISNKYHDYVVIGIQRLQELGEYANWTEYLLYSLTDGFLWLSEEPKHGWFVSRVLNDFPVQRGNGIYYDNKMWNNYDGSYHSQVIFAIGAFSWQVKVKDVMTLTDYKNGSDVITAEQNESEITYTIANPISNKKMQTWFGSQFETVKRESYASYNPEYNSVDGYHNDLIEETGFRSIIHLIAGLSFSYFFFFMGSGGAFILALIMLVIGIILFAVLTNEEHNYDSMGEVLGSVVSDKSPATKISAWIIVFLTFFLSLMMFNTPDKSSSSSSGIYYVPGSSSGRTGYSSSGSHK